MKKFLLTLLCASLVVSITAAPRKKTQETTNLQTELTRLGYFHGTIDGYKGPETDVAEAKAIADGKLIPAPTPEVVYKLSPKQRKLAIRARDEVDAAIAGQTKARAEADEAKISAALSSSSAKTTEEKLLVAEAQAKREHDELVRSEKENVTMRPIVKQVNSYWGLGAIAYGFKRLATHLLILTVALIVIGILVMVFVPWLRPILGVAGSAVGGFFKVIGSMLGGALKNVPSMFSGTGGWLKRMLEKFKNRTAPTPLPTSQSGYSGYSGYQGTPK